MLIPASVTMMGWMRAKGRKSGSYDGGMRSFLGRDHARFLPRVGLWEVPVSVHALLRTPFVGTFFLSGPRGVRMPLVAEALRRRHLHLELHAIDLADEKGDGFDPVLVEVQPELKVPLKERRQRLTDLLKARGGGQSIVSAVSRAER